ncbi:Hypothetical predicted protein [Octopus vulgaris]|uniref:Uncharacterized protein n=1 Tax=Octopus vulgaris TaxID=6645 RepID=A0AA36B2K1_OCTVU|nr:Hypothetical predicted protein [Octopus vulgaris]
MKQCKEKACRETSKEYPVQSSALDRYPNPIKPQCNGDKFGFDYGLWWLLNSYYVSLLNVYYNNQTNTQQWREIVCSIRAKENEEEL